MEGMGIWIFLLLFYLLQALVKRKKKQQRQQETNRVAQGRIPDNRSRRRLGIGSAGSSHSKL